MIDFALAAIAIETFESATIAALDCSGLIDFELRILIVVWLCANWQSVGCAQYCDFGCDCVIAILIGIDFEPAAAELVCPLPHLTFTHRRSAAVRGFD